MQFFSVFFAAILLAQIMAARTTTVSFNAASMKVARTATGYCWTGSIASLRSDAYRCMVGNSIHDPCFSVNAKSVACPTNPVANTGIRIALNKPLPRANPNAAPNAWMITLAGGTKCDMGTGTITPGYPFYCSGGIVCAAPLSQIKAAAVFVRCGHPQGGRSVTGTGRYLVTMMYQ
jgi:hypothetical protein